MKSDLVDIAGVIHAETLAAILFSDTADRADAKWLPKSQIEIEYDGGQRNFVTVTMPERLAIDKEFV